MPSSHSTPDRPTPSPRHAYQGAEATDVSRGVGRSGGNVAWKCSWTWGWFVSRMGESIYHPVLLVSWVVRGMMNH